MKNKQNVLNQIESARVQISSLKKGLKEKTISEEIAKSVLNRIEGLIDSIENLIDLEDESF